MTSTSPPSLILRRGLAKRQGLATAQVVVRTVRVIILGPETFEQFLRIGWVWCWFFARSWPGLRC